jgi:hypothetical protein
MLDSRMLALVVDRRTKVRSSVEEVAPVIRMSEPVNANREVVPWRLSIANWRSKPPSSFDSTA